MERCDGKFGQYLAVVDGAMTYREDGGRPLCSGGLEITDVDYGDDNNDNDELDRKMVNVSLASGVPAST